MKSFLTLVTFLIGLSSVAQTFLPQNSGVTTQLNALNFSSPSTGIVVGNGGVIRKTSDAGLNWLASNSGTTVDLNDVVYLTASTYLAVGELGTILKTTNGGTSWTLVNSGTTKELLGICAVGVTLYITGSDGTVLKSTNSGNAWTASSTGVLLKLNKPYFLSALLGYVVGDAGTILNTINGGQTWNFLPSGTTTYSLTDICFTDPAKGVVTGGVSATNEAILLKTTNSGSIWTDDEIPNIFLSAVDFPDASTGYAVGGSIPGNTSIILKTTNQGNSWSPVASSSSRQLGICFPNPQIGYTCGLNGTILRYAANTLGLEENQEPFIQITPNPGKGLFTVSPETGTAYTIHVFSPEGKQIVSVQNSNTIDLSAFPSGMYLVHIQSANLNATQRLVKE